MKRMDSGLRTVDPFTISLFIFVMVLVSFLVLIALTDDPVRRAMLISASLVSITIMVCFSMMLLRRRMDSRTETLVFVRRCATLSRFVYAERMVESYRHRHAITDRWEGVDSPLISRKEWIPHSLIRLGDVFELNSSFEYINGYRVAGNGEKDPKDTVLVERDMRALLPRPDRYLSYNNKMFLKKNSFDDELFIIKSIEGDCNHGKIRMDVRYTSYDHYIDTCEFLMLRDVHHMEEGIDGDLTIDLENYNNRAAGIGVCTLTILRLSDGKDYMLIHHRSDKLGEAPGVISLVPAGSFSPSGDEEYGVRASQGHDDAKTPRIIDTIFREFEEEILGSENVEFATDYERLGLGEHAFYLCKALALSVGVYHVRRVTVQLVQLA